MVSDDDVNLDCSYSQHDLNSLSLFLSYSSFFASILIRLRLLGGLFDEFIFNFFIKFSLN